MFSGVDDIARFDLGISIHDWFAVGRYPSAQSLAYFDLQGRQHAEVLAADEFRQKPSVPVHEHGNRKEAPSELTLARNASPLGSENCGEALVPPKALC